MITDHRVSANSYFHREEVGSSWSGGVASEAGLPSAGRAHLEEKQSIMGRCWTVTKALVLREREDNSLWYNRYKGGKDAGKDLSVAPGWVLVTF